MDFQFDPSFDLQLFLVGLDRLTAGVRRHAESGNCEGASRLFAHLAAFIHDAEHAVARPLISRILAALELPANNDLSAVGMLAEAALYDSRERQALARTALIDLLPRLTAEELRPLHQHYRRCLVKLLSRSDVAYVPDFMVILLAAIARLGETSALPEVERLSGIDDPIDPEWRILAAARDCSRMLRHIARKERHARTLLRVAVAPGSHPDRLLRPAGRHGGSNREHRELPRAACAACEEAAA